MSRGIKPKRFNSPESVCKFLNENDSIEIIFITERETERKGIKALIVTLYYRSKYNI